MHSMLNLAIMHAKSSYTTLWSPHKEEDSTTMTRGRSGQHWQVPTRKKMEHHYDMREKKSGMFQYEQGFCPTSSLSSVCFFLLSDGLTSSLFSSLLSSITPPTPPHLPQPCSCPLPYNILPFFKNVLLPPLWGPLFLALLCTTVFNIPLPLLSPPHPTPRSPVPQRSYRWVFFSFSLLFEGLVYSPFSVLHLLSLLCATFTLPSLCYCLQHPPFHPPIPCPTTFLILYFNFLLSSLWGPHLLSLLCAIAFNTHPASPPPPPHSGIPDYLPRTYAPVKQSLRQDY